MFYSDNNNINQEGIIMSYILKTVLDTINSYKTFLEQNINSLITLNLNTANMNLFCTGEYKLFSIIVENVRMDLNYLLVLNPEYDMLGFPAIKRNIRISIEAYYDLFNLVQDRSYFELLQYQSIKGYTINPNTLNKYKAFVKGKISNINKRPLTILDKGNIAKNKNQLHPNLYNEFKDMATNSNSYIHPDIFVTDNYDRETVLKLLILCDCRLLMYAFELLNNFIKQQNAPYISVINPYAEYEKLYNYIMPVYWIYL